jgi:hypothetical protein
MSTPGRLTRHSSFISDIAFSQQEEDSMDSLEGLVQLLVALSIASERLVEIIKGFVPFLTETIPNSKLEGRRRSILHILAVISGIVTAFLARSLVDDIVPAEWDHPTGYLALGLLAAGGSGFWNGILSYVLEVKNLKKRTTPAVT